MFDKNQRIDCLVDPIFAGGLPLHPLEEDVDNLFSILNHSFRDSFIHRHSLRYVFDFLEWSFSITWFVTISHCYNVTLGLKIMT